MATKHFICDLGDGRLGHRSSQSREYKYGTEETA